MSYHYWILDHTSWIQVIAYREMVATCSLGEIDYSTVHQSIFAQKSFANLTTTLQMKETKHSNFLKYYDTYIQNLVYAQV